MERYVECESRGLTLRGMLHVPDQRPGKVPFVILFHGFCDDRNEINFVHTELSRRPVSYTHLDVYKRQPAGCVSGGSPVSGSTLPAAATATGGSRT